MKLLKPIAAPAMASIKVLEDCQVGLLVDAVVSFEDAEVSDMVDRFIGAAQFREV